MSLVGIKLLDLSSETFPSSGEILRLVAVTRRIGVLMGSILPFTRQVIKNLFSEPATTQYPFVPKEYPERTRGHVDINKDDCILCGMCMRSCPPGAIKVDRAGKTWSINRFDCVQCGYCVEKCPKKCLSITPGYQEPGPEKFSYSVEVPYEPPKPAAKPAAPAKVE